MKYLILVILVFCGCRKEPGNLGDSVFILAHWNRGLCYIRKAQSVSDSSLHFYNKAKDEVMMVIANSIDKEFVEYAKKVYCIMNRHICCLMDKEAKQ